MRCRGQQRDLRGRDRGWLQGEMVGGQEMRHTPYNPGCCWLWLAIAPRTCCVVGAPDAVDIGACALMSGVRGGTAVMPMP